MYRINQTNEQKCLICGQKADFGIDFRYFFANFQLLCCNCRKLLVLCNRIVVLGDLKVRALYQYNDFYRKLIIRFKEIGDEALADIIIYPFAKKLKTQYLGYTACGIPSSLNKQRQRGFSHVEKMFRLLELEYREIFVKDDFLQKQQNFYQRRSISEHIRLKEPLEIKGKILLVDDVATTGQTLLSCYSLLRRRGYHVEALVGAISTQLVNQKMYL